MRADVLTMIVIGIAGALAPVEAPRPKPPRVRNIPVVLRYSYGPSRVPVFVGKARGDEPSALQP